MGFLERLTRPKSIDVSKLNDSWFSSLGEVTAIDLFDHNTRALEQRFEHFIEMFPNYPATNPNISRELGERLKGHYLMTGLATGRLTRKMLHNPIIEGLEVDLDGRERRNATTKEIMDELVDSVIVTGNNSDIHGLGVLAVDAIETADPVGVKAVSDRLQYLLHLTPPKDDVHNQTQGLLDVVKPALNRLSVLAEVE